MHCAPCVSMVICPHTLLAAERTMGYVGCSYSKSQMQNCRKKQTKPSTFFCAQWQWFFMQLRLFHCLKAAKWAKQVFLAQSWCTMKHTWPHLQISTYCLHFQICSQGMCFNCHATFMFGLELLWYVIKAHLSCEGCQLSETGCFSIILAHKETYLIFPAD